MTGLLERVFLLPGFHEKHIGQMCISWMMETNLVSIAGGQSEGQSWKVRAIYMQLGWIGLSW
ncbi:hypothetical protein M404DRAFT_992559 [Pisolithus tinctorius Marx 270]|uniref:Uncharacterized protein n=1 Tax=Pisolithus tinctorius Marx 270 TaxID=870435 RepID=A0A0C3KXQ1_PISTI|nr:hypothetical protein M404DRAFT_992559 [Pisolithus tinctorius Marx 270]